MKIRIHTTHSLLDPNSAPNSTGLRSCAGTRLRRVSAFTLVETAVATFLAAIMLSALYGAIEAGFSTVQVSRESLRATQIILQRMEAIRLSSYNSLQDATSHPTNFTD